MPSVDRRWSMRHSTALFLLVIAMSGLPLSGRAQGAFPRDGNESLALRIHNWYRQSQDRLALLEADRIKVKGFISEVAPASTMVGTAIAPEDVAKLAQIDEDIAREQARCRLLEAAWEKNRAVPPAPPRSFVWRYGPLSNSGQRSVDPKYDRIEYAIRNFPFSEMPAPPVAAGTTRGASPFDGTWHTVRQHSGCCSYSARADLTFSTDASGMTSSANSDFLGPTRGRATGASLTLDWASGHATLELSADGRSFSGSFSSNDGHRGTIRGTR